MSAAGATNGPRSSGRTAEPKRTYFTTLKIEGKH